MKCSRSSCRFILSTLLLLTSSLLFIPESEARFCWDLDKTGCSLTDIDTRADYYYAISGNEINDRKANNGGQGHKFRMRPECNEDDDGDGCVDDQRFTVQLTSYSYAGTLNYTPTLGNRKDNDIELHIHGGNLDKDEHDWEVGVILNGEAKNDYTKDAYLKLEFSKEFVDNLSTGSHRFIFNIEGNNGDDKRQTLTYVFYIYIQPQVQITGLEDSPLGSFPDYENYFQQNFCVYTTGDGRGQGGKFALYGESRNGFRRNYYLARSNSTLPRVSYIAKVGTGADADEADLLRIDEELGNVEFDGHASVGCGGSENMTLRIELDATFQEISRLPAGNYNDVLTLIVEAL